MVERTGVTAYLHPDDDWLASDPDSQLQSIFGFLPPERDQFAPPDRYTDLKHAERLPLAGMTFEVRHTPGHTPGHCVFVVEDEGVVFSGDQLFAGSVGRTDLPRGDFRTLMDSMENEMLTLDADIRVLPGHGPATSIGTERTTNPFIVGYTV